jgi:hypothetical protein
MESDLPSGYAATAKEKFLRGSPEIGPIWSAKREFGQPRQGGALLQVLSAVG